MSLKAQLRQQFKLTRAKASSEDVALLNLALSSALATFLRGRHPHPKTVFAFAGVRGEPDLSAIAGTLTSAWALPRITGVGIMEFVAWHSGAPLQVNKFGIPEPLDGKVISPNAGDVILVPALALDKTGVRLGFGGGYYDRFLARYPELITVGIAYDEFHVAQLPIEPHDIRVAWRASELGVFPC